MLTRLVLAAVVAVVVFLVCILLGMVFAGLPPIAMIGAFLTQWAWVIGLIAGVWYFFRGGFTFGESP